jgi:hypothetical protein
MSNGVKVPDQLAAAFDDLIIHDVAVNAAMARFLAEQKAVVMKSKELWLETMRVMGLSGEWRYADGMVYPVVTEQKDVA